MFSKAHTSAVAAEFIGTFVLSLAVLTVSKSSLNLPFFVSATAGIVVAGMMLLFGRISGAQLNPAITIGSLSVKRVTPTRAVVYVIAQLIGGFLAYYLFAYYSGQKWHSTGVFESKILVAEVIGTFIFSLAWAAIVFQKLESAKAVTIAGLSLTISLVAMSSAGVVSLNPAVSLGLRSWLWGSTVLGPIIGALVGFQVYKYLFAPESAQTRRPSPGITSVRNTTAQLRRTKPSH